MTDEMGLIREAALLWGPLAIISAAEAWALVQLYRDGIATRQAIIDLHEKSIAASQATAAAISALKEELIRQRNV